MQRRDFIKQTGAAGLIVFIPSALSAASDELSGSALEENFSRPPHAALPQTYWFWMNGNVTKEGITLDLEAMQRVGIGGVFNFDVGTGIPKGPVQYLSEGWIELKKHAIREAARLGLEFTMHNCPGWSASGGPWITPELAMQQVTSSETYIAGGKKIELALPKPAYRLNYYRDLAVLAFPSLEGEDLLQTANISSSSGAIITDKSTAMASGIVVHPAGDSVNRSAWLQLEFSRPYEAKLLTFFISAIADETTVNKPLEFGERTSIKLEASDDGQQFRLVTTISTGLETELLIGDKFIAFDIPVTKAKYFRLTSAKTRRYRQVQFSGITRLKNWMEKTNNRARYVMMVEESSTIDNNNQQQVPQGSIIDFNNIINITQYTDKDGRLSWDAPAGNWTILRLGFTPTGSLNRAAPENGVGLECDKYNKAAMSFHFNKMMERFLPLIGSLDAGRKIGLEIDSYEAGTQNWTDGFEKEFQKRMGYDVINYLPAVAGGRIVSSVDFTERFLWDFRRVQAELIAENYYAQFNYLCDQHNITSYIEPYDSGPMEEMQIGSKADVNMGEFWNGISSISPVKHPVSRTVKLAATIAHINDQKVTGAEAFTAEPDSGKWQEYPFALKAIGDRVFTKGVNRLVFHRYAHQPHTSAMPGMTMGPWGIHFDRTNTWWNQGKAWLNYLSRCQSMLQQGHFAADLLYFSGEDANMYTKVNPDELNPMPPTGYDYDLVNAETILNKIKIVDGRIVLPNGMTYRIFILQNYKAVTFALLSKLKNFVQQGMIMVGTRPERTPGLADHANGDASFKQLVNELWGNIDGSSITENIVGKGKVFSGQALSYILEKLNIAPDFEFTSRSGDAPVIYIHRKINDGDVYFLSNQRRTYEELVCSFRVKNKQPELWDAVTGKIIQSGLYELIGNRVRMPLQLGPYGSVFVVFRSVAGANRLHAVEKDGVALLSTKNFPAPSRSIDKNSTNNFTIGFFAKPEINIVLNADFIPGTTRKLWTEYYAIYPPAGKDLYGEGHAVCGITAGRNGVAVWEHSTDTPVLVLAAPARISGWSHITVLYKDGTPSVYLDGKFLKKGGKSKYNVHPAPGKAWLTEGASYYNGDMT
ncbi:MAG: glycosyl hydrolase, partial [Chitinophagaceae bacterium]